MNTHYWPEAVRYREENFGPNSFEDLFTYVSADTLEEAEEMIRIWKVRYGYKLITSTIKRISDNGEEIIRRDRNYGLIKDLWADFADVPMNPETEQIEQKWGSFAAGTHREEIWHWFEEQFGVSVGKDLMGKERVLDWNGWHYELVDEVPSGYNVWPIGSNMIDGYLPLCMIKPKELQPFDGAGMVFTDNLKAIRTDGAQKILDCAIRGIEKYDDMLYYIESDHDGEDPYYVAETKHRCIEALQWAKQIKWENDEERE